MVNGYDPTTSTRASAIENDVQRKRSAIRRDPELRLAQERSEGAYTVKLAIFASIALAVFVFIWWLAVH